MIHINAPAKINLSLHIKSRLPNGYHDLSSLIHKIDLSDQLSISIAQEDYLSISGLGAEILQIQWQDNLIMRAVDAFRKYFAITAYYHIKLDKFIPMEAGLGGGSSNAVSVFYALLKLHNIAITDKIKCEIKSLLLRLGADCPFFWQALNHPALYLMEGVGEDLMPLAKLYTSPYILLIKGAKGAATAQVFQELKGNFTYSPHKRAEILRYFASPQNKQSDFFAFLKLYHDYFNNDLTLPACQIIAEIAPLLTQLQHSNGNLLTGMTGTGATCFGLYQTYGQAQAAQKSLLKKNHSFIWSHICCFLTK